MIKPRVNGGDFNLWINAECAVEIIGLIYCSLGVHVFVMPVRVSFVKFILHRHITDCRKRYFCSPKAVSNACNCSQNGPFETRSLERAVRKILTMTEPKTITINNKEYNLDDLSDNAKAQLGSLQLTDQEIIRLQQQLAIAQTARNAYAQALNEELPKDA